MSERRLDTPLNRVAGLGVAREGVGHWWAQRISSVALIPLTILFVPPFAFALGGGMDAAQTTYANPFNAVVALLFFIVNFWHLQQGLQVVIEDYVHEKWPRTALLLLNTLGSATLAVAVSFAILKISFAG